MKKISTVRVFGNDIFEGTKVNDRFGSRERWLFYCVLDEEGKIILEQKVATTPDAMKQTFGQIQRSLVALKTETHSLRIQEYDQRMEKIAKEAYPEVALLKQVKGVGTQIAD